MTVNACGMYVLKEVTHEAQTITQNALELGTPLKVVPDRSKPACL